MASRKYSLRVVKLVQKIDNVDTGTWITDSSKAPTGTIMDVADATNLGELSPAWAAP